MFHMHFSFPVPPEIFSCPSPLKILWVGKLGLIKVVKELTHILLTHPPFASADITASVLPVNNVDSTAKFLSALETGKNGNIYINLLTLHSCLLSHGSRKLY